MSADTPVTEADAESLPVTGSGCTSPVLVAVFVVVAVVVTVATMVSVAFAPLIKPPRFQTPVTGLYVPALGVAETNVNPAGTRSVTTTPVALLGPLFVTVTVNVTLELSGGVGLSTTFATAMSAAWPVTVAEAASLPGLGSGCASAGLGAVLKTGVVPVTVAMIDRVALAVLAMAPMSHNPVAALYVPALGVAETKVSPAGSWSVTCTPVALLGPLLVAVMVNVTFVFRFGVALLTVLAMAMSAA